MSKLRKTGAIDQDGNVVTIPRLPSVAGSNKPAGWNRRSPAEKVEHPSLDSSRSITDADRDRGRKLAR
jgi:hypothetical protein